MPSLIFSLIFFLLGRISRKYSLKISKLMGPHHGPFPVTGAYHSHGNLAQLNQRLGPSYLQKLSHQLGDICVTHQEISKLVLSWWVATMSLLFFGGKNVNSYGKREREGDEVRTKEI